MRAIRDRATTSPNHKFIYYVSYQLFLNFSCLRLAASWLLSSPLTEAHFVFQISYIHTYIQYAIMYHLTYFIHNILYIQIYKEYIIIFIIIISSLYLIAISCISSSFALFLIFGPLVLCGHNGNSKIPRDLKIIMPTFRFSSISYCIYFINTNSCYYYFYFMYSVCYIIVCV